MSSANKASNLNFLDYEGDAYTTHKTLAPASMADALMQNRKAANVGEQPIAPQDPSVADTLVEELRTSTQTTRRNFMAQLENLVMRDPEALKSFHPEIESYYTAFQKSLHSAMAFRPEPRPSELNYEAKKKTYDVWAANRPWARMPFRA